EHHDARRERGVREGELAADEELVPVEVVAQMIERPAELLPGLVDALRVTIALGLANLREQRRGRGNERVVAVVLEHADARATLRILGKQPRQGILVLQVLVDDRRVVDDLVLVDEDRNLAVRVQAQELRRLLLLPAQIDEDLLVLQIFFRQNDPYLLAKRAVRVVVQFQHGRTSVPPLRLAHHNRTKATVVQTSTPCNIF